jgi:hypothetical protein
VVRCPPAQLYDLIPPSLVSLVARDYNVIDRDTLLLQDLGLDFVDPAGDHRKRSKTFLLGEFTAPVLEVVTSSMNGYELRSSTS